MLEFGSLGLLARIFPNGFSHKNQHFLTLMWFLFNSEIFIKISFNTLILETPCLFKNIFSFQIPRE